VNEIEKELLRKAVEYSYTIEMYRMMYAGRRYDNFFELPFLRKKDLIEDQKKYPPFGSGVTNYINQVKRIHRTSGTADVPLLLALTDNDIKNVIATGKKAFIMAGISENDVVINCMNYCMWMGGFMDHQSLEATGAAVIPYGVGNTENLIQIIRSIPDVCIHATPSYLGTIERIAREKYGITPFDLHIKKGFFGGEGGLDDENYRNKLEEKWGMDIYNANYGMSEVMSIIASEGKEKDGLHFIAGEKLYPELYIKEKKIALNNFIRKGAVGELILSNRCKESQPLIRYATGDVIEILDAEENEEVLNFRFRVKGRSDDMLVVKGINFYPNAVQTLISEYAEFNGNFQIQVMGKGIIDYVRLIVELNDSYEANICEGLKNMLKNDIRRKYFVSCDIELTKQIERLGNKLQLVKRVEKFE
jgi:phenylacetate-CoA ligase